MMIYAVFVQPESPGNIGMLARLMKNFDIDQLVLVDPCKITEETYTFAVHARDIVDSALVVDSLEAALDLVDISVGTTSVAGTVCKRTIPPEELTKNIQRRGDIGILIGRESNGLTNDELLQCDILVTIPTSETYPVMNAAMAAGILFYEIHKASAPSQERLSRREKDLLIEDFNTIVDTVERRYHKNRIAKLIFRRIIGRSFITSRESHTVRGILKKILKKLE
jgi:TrmH family RNA methyltransferase